MLLLDLEETERRTFLPFPDQIFWGRHFVIDSNIDKSERAVIKTELPISATAVAPEVKKKQTKLIANCYPDPIM